MKTFDNEKFDNSAVS